MKPILRAISFILALIISAMASLTVLGTLPRSVEAQPKLLLCDGGVCTMEGRVTFVGTMSEHHTQADGYQAMFRVRVLGPCYNPTVKGGWRELWLEIRSGRMDGVFAHNGPNLINAYSTLLTALTTKKKVQIDGLSQCDTAGPRQPQNLWTLQIGIID